jgi:GT2 family glycosyltransferase
MRYALTAAFHNRRAKTTAFVRHVRADDDVNGRISSYLLFDDGSTDGTSQELLADFPDLMIVRGDGTFYWSGAMRVLLNRASELPDVDALILSNDDIALSSGKLRSALDLFEDLNGDHPTVVVGAFSDGAGNTTYSGMRQRSRNRPLSLEMIPPSEKAVQCDTFNGNLVIIPKAIYKDVGGMNPRFRHLFGDIDLGYRISRTGARIVIAPGHVGVCYLNKSVNEQLNALTIRERWNVAFGPLRSINDYRHFVHAHSPVTAPARVLLEVVKRTLMVLRGR